MSDVEFKAVVVLGAGTMGAGIAQVCAMAGSKVRLNDVDQELLDRGLETIRRTLDKGVDKGKVRAEVRERALANLEPVLDRAAAARGADLAVEAVPEDLQLKQSVFRDLAESCGPEAVLASNTSSLSLADVFAGVPEPGRCVGMHFFNPVPLMALLEVVRPEACADATIDRIVAYGRQLDKEPIVVKDSPGFATSRLGVCLGLEAIRMVEAGVASAEDIDKALELGYRHPMGPLRLTDLVGLDVRLAIADYLREKLGSPVFDAPGLLRRMVDEGKLGKKSGQGFYDWT